MGSRVWTALVLVVTLAACGSSGAKLSQQCVVGQDLVDTLQVRSTAIEADRVAVAHHKKQTDAELEWVLAKKEAEFNKTTPPPEPSVAPLVHADVDTPTNHAKDLATRLAETANKVGDRVLAGYANQLRTSLDDAAALTGVKTQCHL